MFYSFNISIFVIFQSPIQASLLKLDSPELNKVALECFIGKLYILIIWMICLEYVYPYKLYESQGGNIRTLIVFWTLGNTQRKLFAI